MAAGQSYSRVVDEAYLRKGEAGLPRDFRLESERGNHKANALYTGMGRTFCYSYTGAGSDLTVINQNQE